MDEKISKKHGTHIIIFTSTFSFSVLQSRGVAAGKEERCCLCCSCREACTTSSLLPAGSMAAAGAEGEAPSAEFFCGKASRAAGAVVTPSIPRGVSCCYFSEGQGRAGRVGRVENNKKCLSFLHIKRGGRKRDLPVIVSLDSQPRAQRNLFRLCGDLPPT